ncbi:uncharacterized protein N0V89_006768 [Didymosphaeria variabile]|uniref:RING-type domain-containing protein n=1 Tax=Didymosphaeria variabile TaxID=1932322 RepID=A0A9W8XJL9_9PLEO|nr:uncharacterized protein N0V89_006768 [Didymosphaeria variabile]KAJ4351426.1 hypothetical protein N0V89_006768 [Didymosphaeria variabile]
MSDSTERVIPDLALFYEVDLLSISAPQSHCVICLCDYTDDDDAVSVNPCKHEFHRQCINTWFKSQLQDQNDEGNEVIYGTCPCCRSNLVREPGGDEPYINAVTWAQTLYALKGTEFEAVGQLARRHIDFEGDSALTVELVDVIVPEMVQICPEYEQVAISLGVLEPPRTSLLVRVALQQYEVDVATADSSFVNSTIRGDIESLNITAMVNLPDWLHPHGPFSWAAAIDSVFQSWQANNYPRCNYITLPSLHRLVICALLVFRIAVDDDTDTAGFAQLLAHGERLLLETQQRVASGELNEAHLREHYRVLDWTDGGDAGPHNMQDPHHYHQSNHSRIHWVVELRRRTRGPGAGPLTPF